MKGTEPSHTLDEYLGQYENAAYGTITIEKKDTGMQFRLHKIALPLQHFHFDRFDTPNDEEDGLYSLNFITSSQGDIDRFIVSLDENEATFVRRADASLSDPNTLASYMGKYEMAGTIVTVSLQNENQLSASVPGQPTLKLIPKKPRVFGTKEYSDLTIEFIIENGQVKSMKQKDPSGEYELKKKIN